MYSFDLLKKEDSLVVSKGTKIVYNTEGLKTLGDWTSKGDGTLGNLVSHNNNVAKGASDVFITNSKIVGGVKQFPIGRQNFIQCIINFFVRKSVNITWLNQNDEYLSPSDEIDVIKNDTIVYSLFNNSSFQKSNEEFNNEFFWMSVDKMKELADKNEYDMLYNDARTSSDRHVYKLLFGEERIYDKLSHDAKAVLDKATELVEMSMELRKVIANEENQLNSWDAGYAQLKFVWKEHFQGEFKEFRQLYKTLEDRMRPLVYELGFLKK